MKTLQPLIFLTLLGVLSACSSSYVNSSVSSQNLMDMQNDQTEIRQLLEVYETALNTSDVDLALSLYTSDGVFMPTKLPSAKGTEAIRESYSAIFSMIQLNIAFSITEIEVEGKLAFAQTYSRGTVTVKAARETAPEENRELFVFTKTKGEWKIARYMFNKME